MMPTDQQNTGHHRRGSSPGQRSDTLRQTTGQQDFPTPMGRSTSSHSTNPFQNGPGQQRSPTRPQQSGFAHPEDGFLGGFVPPNNDNEVSTSPTSLTPSISVASLQSDSAQRGPPPVSPTEDDECFAWFVAVDQDESGQVSHEELRRALLNDNGLSFSANTVKFLMRIFDIDGNGEISFDEFKPLWNLIMQWRQMFDAFDVDGDGRISGNELSQALKHYKFPVGQPIIDMLMAKYGEVSPPPRNRYPGYPLPPQMDMDHFICACVVVEQMWGLYDSFTAGSPGLGQAPMTRDDFLKSVISLP